MKKMKKAQEAVSEILGTIMLLSIAIMLFSVLSGIVLTYPFTPSPPTINIVGVIDGDEIIIEHLGGEKLSLNTKIVILLNESKENKTAKDLLDDKGKENGYWNIGEKAIFNATDEGYADFENRTVKISVIDQPSKSILLMGTVQEGSKSN